MWHYQSIFLTIQHPAFLCLLQVAVNPPAAPEPTSGSRKPESTDFIKLFAFAEAISAFAHQSRICIWNPLPDPIVQLKKVAIEASIARHFHSDNTFHMNGIPGQP